MDYPEHEKVSHPGITKALLQTIKMSLEGDEANQGWYNGILTAMDNISAEKASTPPGPGRTTAAAHAEHIRFSLNYMNAMFRGEQPQVDWADSWKVQQVNEAEWATIRSEIKREYDRLIEFTEQKPFWREQGLAAMINNVGHTAYHAGAIRQILKGI